MISHAATHCTGSNVAFRKSPGLAHCLSLVLSDRYANLPSQISDFWFNRAPRPVHFVRSAAALQCQLKWPHEPKGLRWHSMSLLHLGISPFCGQQRSIWKYGLDSPSVPSLRAAILSCSYHAIFFFPPRRMLSMRYYSIVSFTSKYFK